MSNETLTMVLAVAALGVAFFGLLVTILTTVAAAVWIVGKINGTTAVLTKTVATLEHAVSNLRRALEVMNEKIGEHGEAIASIEATMDADGITGPKSRDAKVAGA